MNQAEINYKDEKTKQSGGGCCCSTPTTINRTREENKMMNSQNENKQTIVTAPDIVCGGCASSIKKALGNVEGVSNVDVDVATKRVTVNHSENVPRERIVDALDRAGYSVES
jgi:copper chaperone